MRVICDGNATASDVTHSKDNGKTESAWNTNAECISFFIRDLSSMHCGIVNVYALDVVPSYITFFTISRQGDRA